MKHRFYYSKMQEKIGGYNWVFDKNGDKYKYTQWVSNPEHFCNWTDAKLVYKTEDEPKYEFGTIPDNVKNVLDLII